MSQDSKNENQVYNCTPGKFNPSSSNSSLEGNAIGSINETDGKVKTKLMSIWNNVKYGWTVKIKANFSKDTPVWLLGKCYHFRNTGQYHPDEGVEGFKSDFSSRIWLTYRKEFPLLNGSNFTTDCGWGCMIRSGQMMLAQALLCHFLGRDWRWLECKNVEMHRNILKWFGDKPCSSPFSIHTLVQLGETSGKKPGDWYGPASVAHLLKQAVHNARQSVNEFDNITVYIAQDCTVYIQDLLDLCVNEEGEWKSVIILIPTRLGTEKFNPIYGECLTLMLTLNQSIGIIGGRPKHSLYFIGFQENNLIHLDPHYCQNMVDVWQKSFPLNSFHCNTPRKMNLNKMDPSCCFGFYCKTQKDFEEFHQNVQSQLIPSLSQKCDYPMFIFCENRSSDIQASHRLHSNIPIDTHFNIQESEDELECEEFEFV